MDARLWLEKRFTTKAAGNRRDDNIPPQYSFVTIFNDTDYALYFYQGTAAEVDKRIVTVPAYSFVTKPLPHDNRTFYMEWSGGTAEGLVQVFYTLDNLALSGQHKNPAGATLVSITGDTVGLARDSLLRAAPVTVQLAVVAAAAAVPIAVGASALVNRRTLWFRNAGDVYIGPAGVDNTTGKLIAAGSEIWIDFYPASPSIEVYVYSVGGTTLYVWENA